ncbi:MAG: hypothetical protein L3K17_03755 [Thermoplasmata archaeon]|nr:hypothetical protein [Thermoplasmata archaeon]
MVVKRGAIAADIPAVVGAVNLVIGLASLLAVLYGTGGVSDLGSAALLGDLLLVMGLAVYAVFRARPSAPQPTPRGPDSTEPPSRSTPGLLQVLTAGLTFLVALLLIIALFTIPVGHVDPQNKSKTVDFATVQGGVTPNITIEIHSPGEIALNWTEETATGITPPQITVWVTGPQPGPDQPQFFRQVSMYGDPGNGGIGVGPGNYTVWVMQEPTTPTVVYLTAQWVTYSTGHLLSL